MELTPMEQIRVLMKRKGITRTDLAEKLGLAPQSLGQTLRKENPTYQTICKLAEALGCECKIEIREKAGG